MKNRMLAIIATLALSLVGAGSALAAPGGEPGPPTGSPPCGPDSENPRGCEGHPGEHEEEPEEPDEGGECDQLAQLDPAIADACQTVVDTIGGGEPPEPPDGGELPEPPEGSGIPA